VEDKFGGDEPIEILTFPQTFKQAADHNDVGEGAAARLNPYFLKDAAKEGYRAHMDETPVRNVTIVERFDFEACLRARAFQFTRGSALYRECFQFLDEIKAAK
jgi:hypothetical protein